MPVSATQTIQRGKQTSDLNITSAPKHFSLSLSTSLPSVRLLMLVLLSSLGLSSLTTLTLLASVGVSVSSPLGPRSKAAGTHVLSTLSLS